MNVTQTVDYFNVFLAPYVKSVEPEKVKEALRLFILNVNQHVDAAFGLDLTVPAFLAAKPAVAPKGKTDGKYGDYTEEAKL